MEDITKKSLCYNGMSDNEKIDYLYNFLFDFYNSVEFILIIIGILILFLLWISLDSYFNIKYLKKKNENK